MAKWQYTKGLHDLGNGCFAYLQPDGSWGWSNAGLIADHDQTLLVDTLFDLKLTREMLDRMRAAVPAAKSIGRLVNTHSNGDHTFGNQLVKDAEIIASRACAEEMKERPAEELAAMQRNWRQLGEAGAFLHEVMGSKFKWDDVTNTLPTRVFDDELKLKVGDKEVVLKTVGPAHTRGDVLVHVPKDRTVFTGDILFVEGHPVLWAGPVDNWVAACDQIIAWDVETVVPGHGPITDKKGVQAMKDYLLYIKAEARRRYDAGMPVFQAARDIALDRFAGWGDPERMVVNVASLYREFGAKQELGIMELFAEMGRFHAEREGEGRARPRSSARTLTTAGSALPPVAQGVDQRHQPQARRREIVFDAQRIARPRRAADHARPFELAQLQRQHAMRQRGVVAPEVAEALGAVLQIVEQQGRPATAQQAHGLFDWAARDDIFHRQSWLQNCA